MITYIKFVSTVKPYHKEDEPSRVPIGHLLDVEAQDKNHDRSS